jgi:hypothetical protein
MLEMKKNKKDHDPTTGNRVVLNYTTVDFDALIDDALGLTTDNNNKNKAS